MCSHLMEIRVTERKVTSDPAMLKKTSKTKKPEPTDFSVLFTSDHLLILPIPFWFHDYFVTF